MAASEYRDRLYRILLSSTGNHEQAIQRALDLGREYLDLSVGFVTEIDHGEQTIVQVAGEHETITPGAQCPLDEAYCRRTIDLDSALAVQDAAGTDAISDRAQDRFNLGTYIGAKILVQDDTYGTVCFAGTPTRDTEFTDAETTFVELLARLLGQALERRQYERELHDRNRRLEAERDRFKTIADTTFDLLFRLNLDGEFTYVSSAADRILGYSPREMVGTHFTDYNTAASAERAVAAFETILAGDDIEAVELDIRTADGEQIVLEVNGTAATEDGDLVGVHGVGRDITERTAAQQELELKTEAIDEAQTGITILDAQQPDTPLIYVNQGFEQMTGYDADTLTGQSLDVLFGEQTDPDAIATLTESMDAREAATVDLVNYRRDGTPYWSQIRLTPVRSGAAESVTHLLAVHTDITEEKRSEQLFRVLNRVLRHNLRNELGMIRGYGDLLSEDAEVTHADLGTRITEAAQELLDLGERARELEAIARRERLPTRIDPAALLAEVSTPYREQYPDAAITVTVETDRGLCVGSEIRMAISELLENALKHNSGASPRVEIGVQATGEWIDVTFTDNGEGLSEMESTVIAKGTEQPLEHGSGLGLWLVNWIVTRYGGSFQVEATDGEGSRATVRLPGIDSVESVAAAAKRPAGLFS
jgi:PAS domain S-box-containing protein